MNNFMYTRVRTLLAAMAVFTGTSSVLAQFSWNPAGPIYTSGRARAMVVDRNNNNVLYIGSASGGVFRSDNGGSTWRALNDKQGTVRNISYLTQSIDGTIYAGTGEGFLRFGQKARAQPGTGLYKLVDTVLVNVVPSSTVGDIINRVACSPVNANVIALATNSGIWYTGDAGANWTKAVITPTNMAAVTNVRYGMDVKFDNAGILYFTLGNERGSTSSFAGIAGTIWKSTDNTLSTFANITPSSTALSDAVYGRIELAISPSNPSVIYASCANKNMSTLNANKPQTPNLKALFVSTDAGANWDLIAQGAAQLDPLSNGGSIASGDYAHVIVVNPSDPHMLFMGGYTAYVFDASSSSPSVGNWTPIGQRFLSTSPSYLHENIHDIKIVPGNPAKFYFITDAGIYRSTDMISTSQQLPPSFQAIYKGLVTGQFNSVSAERYPITTQPVGNENGQVVDPRYGYIGGTGGNGAVYFSGTNDNVSLERSYIGGEIYNAEYSKILPDAAFFSSGEGNLYRTSNVKTSTPARVVARTYSGALATIAPNDAPLANADVSNGTSFKLWENYGQVAVSPDSIIFYNDSLTVQASIQGLATLTTQTTFTFQAGRLNRFARIDSIAIRTATVPISSTGQSVNTAFSASDKKDIRINVLNDVSVPTTSVSVQVQNGTQIQYLQTYSGTNVAVTGTAAASATAATVKLNHTSLLDDISVTFNSAPFANKTQTYAGVPDPASFYRVFATIFYRYMPGDTITREYEDISTKETTYFTVLTDTLRWAYGSIDPTVLVNGFVPFAPQNKPVAFKGGQSARIAMHLDAAATNNNPAIVVSKAPLNMNDPMSFVRVSVNGTYKDDANGNPTNLPISIARPYLVEWSKSGTEIYFASTEGKQTKLFRVSHITRLMDNSSHSYSGKLSTDVFRYVNGVAGTQPNPNCPYRTTLLGTFDRTITSLTTSNDGSRLLVTCLGAAASATNPMFTVMTNSVDVRKADFSNQVWMSREGSGNTSLAGKNVYCALMEMRDNNKVLVGTDAGLMYTDDITASSPVWQVANNNQLPSVQVFDIDQQVMTPDAAYNSGEIYVATNGRGVWSNRSFLNNYIVDVQEHGPLNMTVENNLTLFPNPSAGLVTVGFGSVTDESAVLQVMDLSGRTVHTENLGKLSGEDFVHTFDTGRLSAGIYLVNISSDSGVKRVSKLVLTK